MNPNSIFNQVNGIAGEHKVNQIPITSSITIIGLSLPLAFSTIEISGNEITISNKISIKTITVRQSAGNSNSRIIAMKEANVPGNLGKYPAPKNVAIKYSTLNNLRILF